MEPVFTKLFGAASHPVGAVISSRARIAFAKNDAKRADELMTAAIAMLGDDKRADRAELQMFHARVLLALGKRDDARTHAEAAATDYAAAGTGFASRAEAARTWAAKPTAAVPPPVATPDAPARPPEATSQRPTPPAASDACGKAGRKWDRLWPGDERDLIEGWHEKDPERGERVISVIDQFIADWRTAARAACADDRRMMCLERARATAKARIKSVGNGTTRAIADRKSLPDLSRCADADHVRNLVYPSSDEQREAIEFAEEELEYTRILLDINYPSGAERHVSGWGSDAIAKSGDPSITARAEKLRAEIKEQYAAKKQKP
jgi:hypothetical protein